MIVTLLHICQYLLVVFAWRIAPLLEGVVTITILAYLTALLNSRKGDFSAANEVFWLVWLGFSGSFAVIGRLIIPCLVFLYANIFNAVHAFVYSLLMMASLGCRRCTRAAVAEDAQIGASMRRKTQQDTQEQAYFDNNKRKPTPTTTSRRKLHTPKTGPSGPSPTTPVASSTKPSTSSHKPMVADVNTKMMHVTAQRRFRVRRAGRGGS